MATPTLSTKTLQPVFSATIVATLALISASAPSRSARTQGFWDYCPQ